MKIYAFAAIVSRSISMFFAMALGCWTGCSLASKDKLHSAVSISPHESKDGTAVLVVALYRPNHAILSHYVSYQDSFTAGLTQVERTPNPFFTARNSAIIDGRYTPAGPLEYAIPVSLCSAPRNQPRLYFGDMGYLDFSEQSRQVPYCALRFFGANLGLSESDGILVADIFVEKISDEKVQVTVVDKTTNRSSKVNVTPKP